MATEVSYTEMISEGIRAVGDGAKLPAEALIEALDGSERKLLLARLARAEPVAVAAGVAWLAEYHAANAERRRTDRNRKSKDRRRRKLAEGLAPAATPIGVRPESSLIDPATSGRRSHPTAHACASEIIKDPATASVSAAQAFPNVKRRAWDSNPRARSPLLAVFKTAAIGH
jgi:hypothetical protein